MIFKVSKRLLIAICLTLLSYVHADEGFVQRAKDAKNKAANAFSLSGGEGPEQHTALITAYWLNPGDCALDLGSYVGNYSLFYSGLVGLDGVVIAYEASPVIFNHLMNRLMILSNANIIAKNKAISDTTNQSIPMKIYPDDVVPQSCTVESLHWNTERMPGKTEIVQVLTERVDDLLEQTLLPPIRFVKIDTEGHEHAVIRGATRLLLEHRPLVIFEYGFQKGYWEPDTIRQMEELNYVCYDCNTNFRVQPGYGKEAVPYLLTDLLAIPVEFEEEIAPLLPYLY